MKKSPGFKILLFMIIICLIWMFFLFDLDHYFSLSNLKNELTAFKEYYGQHKIATMGIYMVVYILMAALSLPGAAVMTLAGGALFGFVGVLVAVPVAAVIGVVVRFLVGRYRQSDIYRGTEAE